MTTGIFKAVQRRIQAPSTARGEIAHAVAKSDERGCVNLPRSRESSLTKPDADVFSLPSRQEALNG